MVIPSEIEQHLGEVWDPAEGKQEIELADGVIQTFISEMNANQIPSVTIEEIVKATDVLGLYAGYPIEAMDMESYIKTDEVLSFREVASILEVFSDNMNSLINQRIAADRNNSSEKPENVTAEFSNVPF
jgi:hypothetical protein